MLSFLLRWSVLFVVLAVGGLALHGMLNRERFEEGEEDVVTPPASKPEPKPVPAATPTLGQRIVRAYKRTLGRPPSDTELKEDVERFRTNGVIEDDALDADIVQKKDPQNEEQESKEGFVAADSPRPPVRQQGDRDAYTEHIEERNREASKNKAKWANQSLVLLPEMKWHLPQPREPVCHLSGKPITVEPVVDRTSLIGTLLE